MEVLDAIDWGAAAHFRFMANQQPGLVAAMRRANDVCTSDALPLVLVMAAMLLRLLRGRTGAALLTLGAWGVGYLLVEGLRNTIHRERPHDAWEMVDTFEMMSSFPARSVLLGTLAVALLVPVLWDAVDRRSLRWLVTALGVLTVLVLGFVPIYLRLHYVSDVIGGLLGGLSLGVLTRLLTAPARTLTHASAAQPALP